MSKLINLADKRFGKLTVVKWIGYPYWECLCDCGKTKLLRSQGLRTGESISCGCVRNGRSKRPEYPIWNAMLQRCSNKNNIAYHNYGGRGITVCKKWHDFNSFYADMGPRPNARAQIDRIDNSKGYEPENCRWTTIIENQRNTRRNAKLTFDGKTLTIAEWAEITGLPYHTIYLRVKRRGWYVEDALTIPRMS